MRDRISERHIVCEVCTASIDLTVRADGRVRFEIHATEELLVDYGWLPTTRGAYCPDHARRVRGNQS
ncbi:hypothetical protein ORI20_23060 [Mycobacterium sp. CVI_P3]|uniref:Uncharacterized protein n=1 Tax=Mycobacterium pinniadriaticum TaxID=2994102 RepID=A0ABT3SJ39_9MYCO|nr:hypothetical protein [Mycobacterium pinniadriaticum]MCX2933155.1 hypothetical protein [Mycobacterium pinniadriaticum]MCX2939545.1 hypothetical protein [Mycobacterium pinniadriaticum]